MQERKGVSLVRPAELELFADMLSSRLLKSTSMLEVGTFEGVTASMLAERCPEATIVSLDPFIDDDTRIPGYVPKRAPGRLVDWFHNSRSNQKLFVGFTRDFYAISHCAFDLVLVDGSHLYADVLEDLQYTSRMLQPDGVLAVHDYADAPEWPEVRQATDEFLRSAPFTVKLVAETTAFLVRK